jgi:hypothetical protein
MFMNTGSQIAGRPSMGSWVTYGLGVESEDLPGLRRADVSLGSGGQNQPIAARQWSSRLPAHAASKACSSGPRATPSSTSATRAGVSRDAKAAVVDAIDRAQPAPHDAVVDDPEIATRIAQYEMAFQMQASVPELMDCHSEHPGHARPLRRASPATARSPPTACSPGGSPSAACASSSSITRTGTTTAA